MTVKEIMNLEESLLLCKNRHQFSMPFDDYIIMHELIDKIENITNLYFTIIIDYEKQMKKDDTSFEERKGMLQDYNKNILNCNIDIELTKYNEWMKKYLEF